MIAYKIIENSEKKTGNYVKNDYELVIDGIEVENIHVVGEGSNNKGEFFSIYSRNVELTDRILQHSWFDYDNLSDLRVPLSLETNHFLNSLLIEKDKKGDAWFVSLYSEPQLSFWSNSFSYEKFQTKFLELSNNQIGINIEVTSWNDEEIAIELDTTLVLENVPLIEQIKPFIAFYKSTYNKTIKLIENDITFNQINNSFKFPDKLKISCEQYLLYFAQFLQDLGINATSNLKEEAGKVLFSVTPTDETQALDKIREALAVYLKLPESPIVYDDSFKSMRLRQQIENLQHSQRMAARELQFSEKLLAAQSDMLHEKNLTISQLQSVNEQQQKIIEKISSKSIMMDSVENKEELEKIYDGLEAGYSKWLYELTGIKANVIKVVKTAVKNAFGKDEKNSVLGLDEES